MKFIKVTALGFKKQHVEEDDNNDLPFVVVEEGYDDEEDEVVEEEDELTVLVNFDLIQAIRPVNDPDTKAKSSIAFSPFQHMMLKETFEELIEKLNV